MGIPEICITFISALLGVAYPILLEVVSRLDEKYASLVITEKFKEEIEWKMFRYSLFSSLCCVFIYILINLPFLAIDTSECFTVLFTSVFVLSTTLLIIVFLFFVKKVMLYYSPNQILLYFNKGEDTKEHTYFKATSDILHLAIRKQDTLTAKTSSDIIYKNFRNYRLANPNEPVIYPDDYYQMVYKTIQELIYAKDERFIYLDHRTVGAIWYLGEHEKAQIHENTFAWMWRSLVLAVKFDRDDMLMHYWSVAHQHFMYELSAVHPEHVRFNEEYVIQNKEDIEHRELERERFLEFNYAAGGLLLFRQRHVLLNRIFRYTTSIPPSYDLLPLRMTEVFELYFKFRDPYDHNFPFVNSRYFFPDSEGILGENTVKFWICKYAALLFIRQYTIIPHMVYMEPLAFPAIPHAQSTKRIWIENIDHFKGLVEELLSDQKLLVEIGFDYLTNDWFLENDHKTPLAFIEEFKQSLLQAFDDTEQNQPISPEKEQIFKDSTKEIMLDVLNEYIPYLKTDTEQAHRSWFIPSISMVVEKSAFSDNQDVHHTNYDRVLAGQQASRIRRAVSETFFSSATESFLLNTEDLFKAVDRLNLNDEFIIVNFGIDLNYHIHFSKIEGLKEKSYKHLQIITFDGYNRTMINPSFYILKKDYLPSFDLKEVSQKQTDKYNLEEIETPHHIYASLTDLNNNQELREEIAMEGIHADLQKSVLMYIGTNIEIQWRKDAKMLALSQISAFRNRGVANNISDIRFSF